MRKTLGFCLLYIVTFYFTAVFYNLTGEMVCRAFHRLPAAEYYPLTHSFWWLGYCSEL